MAELTTVLVRYFAAAEDAAGRDEEVLELPSTATLADLSGILVDTYGDAMGRVLRNGSLLVDSVVCRDLANPIGQRVDVLPPFAGG